MSDVFNCLHVPRVWGMQREITSTKQQQPHTMAQRLSRNRAARRAAVDIQNVEHVNEVYHLNRRIEVG